MRTAVLVLVFCAVAVAAMPPFSEGKYVRFPEPPAVLPDSSHEYDVRFYRIDLSLPMFDDSMTAHARVDVTSRRAGLDTLRLDFESLVCDSVRRGNTALAFSAGAGLLSITLDRPFNPGESLTVDIKYHRRANTPLRGFYWYPPDSTGFHTLCYSTTEPSDSRYWFPCFDEPFDKAERGCAVNVTAPDTFSACANGLLDSVTTNGAAHTRTWWWRESYPISTYLMTFAVSRWSTYRQWFHTGPAESTYVLEVVWPEDSVQSLSAFANVVDMMNFFDDSLRYGRFPFERYGMVEAYPFMWGGMENQTMTMIHHWWVQYGSDNGIAHEMSHHWWGDMVTCQDWRNVWLNEGFATYSDELYQWHQYGVGGFHVLIDQRAHDYFSEESTDTHPVYDPPYPDHLFDWGHTYCKGAWVQHMLRYVEGDTVWNSPGVFFRGLRAYGESLAYRNATTDDYRRIQEHACGLDLSWFFNEWVYGLGYPRYDVGWCGQQTADGWQVVVNLTQDNWPGAPAVFHMPVQIEVTFTGGDTVIQYDVTQSPQQNVFPVRNQPTGLAFDPNDWILCTSSVVNGIEEGREAQLPTALHRSGPNPSRGPVGLRYTLGADCPVKLDVSDAAGRVVRTLAAPGMKRGAYSVTWDRRDDAGRPVAAGVYLARLVAGRETSALRLVLVR